MNHNKTIKFALLGLAISSFFSFSVLDNPTSFPDIELKNLAGESISTSKFNNDSKPYIVVLWASWNKPSVLELNTINDVYEDWQSETECKIIAVSIDDVRNSSKVKPFVEGKDWPFEIYLDENSTLFKAMNAATAPATYILNGKNEITWSQEGFNPGDEEVIYKQLTTAK